MTGLADRKGSSTTCIQDTQEQPVSTTSQRKTEAGMPRAHPGRSLSASLRNVGACLLIETVDAAQVVTVLREAVLAGEPGLVEPSGRAGGPGSS